MSEPASRPTTTPTRSGASSDADRDPAGADRGSSVGPRGPGEAAPLEAVGLRKRYHAGDGSEIHVLSGVDLRVGPGEAIAVTGASGAGKSTLLHLLGALDRPTSGEVLVGGRAVSNLDEQALASIRNRHVGYVFQFHHLLREFTALENVIIPALIGGEPMGEAEARARRLLEAVGLDHRLSHKPWQLSGGEQQRVAVARSLVNDPLVLLADEPSGNLDHQTSQRLHDLLFSLRHRSGPEPAGDEAGKGSKRTLAMVLVTHNLELAERADRLLHL